MRWIEIAVSEDVVNDDAVARVAEGICVALYRQGSDLCAIGNICPHQGNVLLSTGWLEDGAIECPLHQARFDIRTGKCLSGPSEEDVPVYPVKEEDGRIYVCLDAVT